MRINSRAAILLVLMAVARGAAAEGPLHKFSTHIERYDAIYEARDGVYDQALAVPQGKVIVGVFIGLIENFGPSQKSMIFTPDEITVMSGEEKLTPVGKWRRRGDFSRDVQLVLNQPADRAKPRPLALNLIYLIPESQKELTLTVASQTLKLKVPDRTQSALLPPDTQSEQGWAAAVDSVTVPDGGEMKSPRGRFLLVHMVWSARSSNDPSDREGDFVFVPQAYNLRLGRFHDAKAPLVPLFGELDEKGHLIPAAQCPSVSVKPSRDKPDFRPITFVFTIPEAPDSATLNNYGQDTSTQQVIKPFKLVKAEAHVLETVPEPFKNDPKVPSIFGPRLTAPSGQVILTVTSYIVPTFSKPHDAFVLKDSLVELLDQDQPIPPIGTWVYYAALYKGNTGVLLYAPDDPKAPPQPLTSNCVYLVPAEKKQFTLKMLNQRTSVMVPTQKTTVDMNDVIACKVVSAKLADEVPNERGVPLMNPGGRLLLVKCGWASKRRNDMTNGEPNFQFLHAWFNVAFGKDQVAPNLAELDLKGNAIGVSNDGGSNSMLTGGAVLAGFKHEDTFVFPVAADITSFELTCFGFPVAKGSVGR